MDQRLVAWARAVKARRRGSTSALPPLWLFTDTARVPEPLAAIRRLPRGLAGVVLRDDAVPDRLELGRAIARLCRARRLALSVAGDWRLAAALRAGLHLRAGRRVGHPAAWLRPLTASAHGLGDLLRARRAGVPLVFLSPVFATASHPGAPGLRPLRWALAARRAGGSGALGGVDGRSVRRLPPAWCRAAGAIGALVQPRLPPAPVAGRPQCLSNATETWH
jgi:thiamine-phosphate pyrophosphorylase